MGLPAWRTGAASTVTTLATAGVNQLFRGVAFTPDAAIAPQFFNAAAGTNGFALAFTTLINRNYTLECTADLGHPDWQTLTNLTTATPVLNLTDTTAPSGTNRFYRLILNPSE